MDLVQELLRAVDWNPYLSRAEDLAAVTLQLKVLVLVLGEEVADVLAINLQGGDFELDLLAEVCFVSLDLRLEEESCAWQDSRHFGWFLSHWVDEERLLCIQVATSAASCLALHGECLPGARLAVCEEAHVHPIEGSLHKWFDLLEHLRLAALWQENLVKAEQAASFAVLLAIQELKRLMRVVFAQSEVLLREVNNGLELALRRIDCAESGPSSLRRLVRPWKVAGCRLERLDSAEHPHVALEVDDLLLLLLPEQLQGLNAVLHLTVGPLNLLALLSQLAILLSEQPQALALPPASVLQLLQPPGVFFLLHGVSFRLHLLSLTRTALARKDRLLLVVARWSKGVVHGLPILAVALRGKAALQMISIVTPQNLIEAGALTDLRQLHFLL